MIRTTPFRYFRGERVWWSLVLACVLQPANGRDLIGLAVSPLTPSVSIGARPQFGATGTFVDLAASAALIPATLAGGDSHTCALMTVGEVRCWGANGSNQLGDPGLGTGDYFTPERAGFAPSNLLRNAIALASGSNHMCAVTDAGAVRCWGDNSAGQLGNGNTNPTLELMTIAGISTARAVAGGNSHTCALLASGAVMCWGANTAGQLGNGTNTSSAVPVNVVGISTAVAIATGDFHSCARLADGTAKCWGTNGFGRLGDGTTSNRNTPVTMVGIANAGAIVAGNDHTCVMLTDGTVRCVGFNGFGQLGAITVDTFSLTPVTVTGISTARALTSGGNHNCVRLADGTARCWGFNSNGQLGNPTAGGSSVTPVAVTGLTNVAYLAGGEFHTCAALVNGAVRCFGSNSDGQLGDPATFTQATTPVPVWGMAIVATIATGTNHTCAVYDGGFVHCWGDNSSGQLGNGQFQGLGVIAPQRVFGITNAIALAAGDSHTCAVLATGSIKCWGQGGNGRLGDGLDTTSATPVTVSGITNAVAVTAGTSHTCALLSTGAMRCWGLNGFGQLGNGNNNIASVPAIVSGITTATAIDAGFNHTCVRLAESTLRCWGSNFTGALGRGNFSDSNVPVAVAGVSTAIGISAGGETGCTVLVSGSVECWGESDSGQLGNGQSGGSSNSPVMVTGITTAVQVTSGDSHSCARLASGVLQCWGSNSATQLGINTTAQSSVPVNVPPVFTQTAITVAAGGTHTCALRADSAAICWGSNAISQLGSVIPGPSAVLNWMSSNANVAAIDAYGLARAIGNGATSIMASFGGISASTTLTVQPLPDADGDGVADQLDNCTLVANPTQLDANNDGFGNICDADLDNSGLVTTADFGLLRSVLNQPANFSALAAAADMNGSGTVTTADFGLLRARLGTAPGPAGGF